MIADIDKGGTGKISYEDFLELMSIKMAEKDSREEILKAFRYRVKLRFFQAYCALVDCLTMMRLVKSVSKISKELPKN